MSMAATPRHPTAQEREQMRALRRKGATIAAIAARTGVSKSAVHRAVRDLRLDLRAAANTERASIPPPWWPAARKLLRAGMPGNAIARELGLPRMNIHRAIKTFG